MTNHPLNDERPIAPCGINCQTCYVYLRTKKPCSGCWYDSENKPNHCVTCSIKNCEYLTQTESKFCFECPKYPCVRLKRMDKRYQLNYKASLMANLEEIREIGLPLYLHNQSIKWKCSHCGSSLSVHFDHCLFCKEKRTI